jgi:tetratricopeptide (TPR) repeat protein
MKLPGYAIRIILALLFLVAAGARFATTSGSQYPYFKGESAMNYRDALTVSDRGSGLDRQTNKSNWPEGYRPARVRPVAVEYLTGAAIGVSSWLSDADPRQVTRRFVVYFFSLCVFTLYALTRNLWGSQAAGLLAAFLAAFFPPLVEATNGRELAHTPIALVLVTLHLLSLQRFARGSLWTGGAGMAATVFLLVGAWVVSPYYIVACVVVATLLYPMEPGRRKVLTLVHLLAFLAAAVSFPHARELRLAFSWQASLLVACSAQVYISARTQRLFGWMRGGAFVLAAGAVLTILATPLRAGAGMDLPALKYVFYKIRFLSGPPAAPSLLPDQIRWLWSSDHAAPGAPALIEFFLPFVFFVPAALIYARKHLWEDGDAVTARARWLVTGAAAAIGTLLYLGDRSAVALAALAAIPLAALAARPLERNKKLLGGATAVGALLIVLQLLWPSGRANAALQIAKAFGIAGRDESKVMWVSLENTDRELVRFVATRTSTRDPFLGKPELTALLLTFSGRTSVLLEGASSGQYTRKNTELTGLMYGDEELLYARCRELGIKYVLYSIDYLLDTTRYSPAYAAGAPVVPYRCAAVSMHFYPEALVHFNLVYQNDHHRLFRVTDTQQPLFFTDHPPVYQREILERNGDTYGAFLDRVNQLMLNYADAMRAASGGNFDAALRRLTWCLREAPMFTQARLAVGTTLLDQGKPEEAKGVFLSVVGYAPDNALGLYYAAQTLSQLGENDQALGLLELLFTATKDTELLQRANLLKSIIERGATVAPDGGKSAPAPR